MADDEGIDTNTDLSTLQQLYQMLHQLWKSGFISNKELCQRILQKFRQGQLIQNQHEISEGRSNLNEILDQCTLPYQNFGMPSNSFNILKNSVLFVFLDVKSILSIPDNPKKKKKPVQAPKQPPQEAKSSSAIVARKKKKTNPRKRVKADLIDASALLPPAPLPPDILAKLPPAIPESQLRLHISATNTSSKSKKTSNDNDSGNVLSLPTAPITSSKSSSKTDTNISSQSKGSEADDEEMLDSVDENTQNKLPASTDVNDTPMPQAPPPKSQSKQTNQSEDAQMDSVQNDDHGDESQAHDVNTQDDDSNFMSEEEESVPVKKEKPKKRSKFPLPDYKHTHLPFPYPQKEGLTFLTDGIPDTLPMAFSSIVHNCQESWWKPNETWTKKKVDETHAEAMYHGCL